MQERCALWASKGECDLNPNFMLRSCQGSCGLCSPGSADVRIPSLPSSSDLFISAFCHKGCSMLSFAHSTSISIVKDALC